MADSSLALRRRALRVPGRASIAVEEFPGSASHFDLHYARTGPRGSETVPTVVVPGGPGLASVVPYERFRRRAARAGLDTIMVEHRGIGLSRHRPDGSVLGREAMRIRFVLADLAAVLDAEGIERAVIVGSSYGSYIAQCFAVEHPQRVDSLVLDSAMFAIGTEDPGVAAAEALFADPDHADPEFAALARKLDDLESRGIASRAELVDHARILYEAAGPQILDRYLNQLRRDRAGGTHRFLRALSTGDFEKEIPLHYEFDPVGEIGFRELNYAASGATHRAAGERFSAFSGPPWDLPAHAGGFPWPVSVISGGRDLRTPRSTAEAIVEAVPEGRLIPVADHGHSALDTHSAVLLAVMDRHARRRTRELSSAAADWEGLPRHGGPSRHLPRLLRASLLWDRLRS